jgi:hypothetical protein
MSCCGQRRRALVTRATGPASLSAAAASLAPSSPLAAHPRATAMPMMEQHLRAARGAADITLRYTGIGPFTARGVRSGRLYACGGSASTLHVDPADAAALLRTRLFTRPRS